MNSLPTPYSDDQLDQILTNFEFYYPESNCFYLKEGNILKRYSQFLSKWILELDKDSINSTKCIQKDDFTKPALLEILLHNKIPRKLEQINQVNEALSKHGW